MIVRYLPRTQSESMAPKIGKKYTVDETVIPGGHRLQTSCRLTICVEHVLGHEHDQNALHPVKLNRSAASLVTMGMPPGISGGNRRASVF